MPADTVTMSADTAGNTGKCRCNACRYGCNTADTVSIYAEGDC